MADVIKNQSTLQLTAAYADGSDSIINIDNPNTAINLAASVDSLGSFIKDNDILLSPKSGASFVEFTDARIIADSDTDLDLSE